MGREGQILLPDDKWLLAVLQGGQDFLPPSICSPVSPWSWPEEHFSLGQKVSSFPALGWVMLQGFPILYQVFPREKEDKLRRIFDSEPCDCHLLGLPGHSISR